MAPWAAAGGHSQGRAGRGVLNWHVCALPPPRGAGSRPPTPRRAAASPRAKRGGIARLQRGATGSVSAADLGALRTAPAQAAGTRGARRSRRRGLPGALLTLHRASRSFDPGARPGVPAQCGGAGAGSPRARAPAGPGARRRAVRTHPAAAPRAAWTSRDVEGWGWNQ